MAQDQRPAAGRERTTDDSPVAQANLRRSIEPGAILKPWLLLGPFYEDLSSEVQGLTLFERRGSTEGVRTMAQVVEEAAPLLRARPSEGEVASFRGWTAAWRLARRPDEFLSWGTYHVANHLGAAFLSTVVTPELPGPRRWRLVTRIPSRVIVVVNGTIVHDTSGKPFERRDIGFVQTFEAPLKAGDNIVNVGLFRIARMARIGCRLEIVDGTVAARVRLGDGVDPALRAAVEEAMSGLSLQRDLFCPDQTIGLTLAVVPPAGTTLRVRLESAAGETLREMTPDAPGHHNLCPADGLADGPYQIGCSWLDADGRVLTSTEYAIRKVTPVPALPGASLAAERYRLALEHFAACTDYREPHGAIWPEVARYAVGRNMEIRDTDEGRIREICAFIAARNDCADFAIQGILRLMCWERETRRLSPELTAIMKETVLGFKYWVDEPGDTVMYMGTENHRLLFHVAEWLAGQLFPLEEFSSSRQRGLFHAMKGRMYITEWLRQRGRFGFDEWHSNAYFPIDVAPLLNIFDFALPEDGKLRQMAVAVLDYLFFILAADTFHGVFGTTHGRSYGESLKYPELEGTATTCWTLFGTGALIEGALGMAPVSIATSTYVLPPILARIAIDATSVVESKQRQGVLKGDNGGARHANFVVYRTPDYLLSGLQDHRKGEFEPAASVAQVTLGNGAVIFWSCPETIEEGDGLRPDYWSGHAVLPRVIQHRNVLALTWRLGERAWMSHCFFERSRFDEVRFAGDWAFARVGDGYAGIWSQHGFALAESGQYAGRELQCVARENTWLVECGRAADWGSFDAFVDALVAAPISWEGNVVTYRSPSIGPLVTGWDVRPMVDGQAIALRGYPLVDSPWAFSAFGSGELAITYGDERYEIWFNQ